MVATYKICIEIEAPINNSDNNKNCQNNIIFLQVSF